MNKKDKASFKMLNAKFAQMEITLMTILLSSVACATLVCIKDVLDLLRYLLKVGSVKFVRLLDLVVLIYLVLFVMWKEERWRELRFTLIQISSRKWIQVSMSSQKDVRITNKRNNTILQINKKWMLRVWLKANMKKNIKYKVKLTNKSFKKRKNHKSKLRNKRNTTMTILWSQHIHQMYQLATMFGFIMFAQFGFLNVTLKRKMVL